MPLIINGKRESVPSKAAGFKALLSLVCVGVAVWWFAGGGGQDAFLKEELEKYDFALVNGQADDASGHASIIAQIYADKGDSENYRKFKELADIHARAYLRR